MSASPRPLAALLLATCAAAPSFAADPPRGERKRPDPRVVEQGYLGRDYLLVRNPEVDGYLAEVTGKLLAVSKEKIATPQILVHSAGALDAMADVNDTIVLSTETLRQLESEDELAALLAHELTHVIRGHVAAKSAFSKLPLGVESIAELSDSVDQVKAQATGEASRATTHASESLSTSQDVSLVWSDFLAPHWNRTQEREADRGGYDLMRAAGYDPAAFTTLLQKLQNASAQRSARMEQFRKKLLARARAQKLPAPDGKQMPAELQTALAGLKDGLSEKVVNEAFDAWARSNTDYDTSQQRQALIEMYERESGYEEGDKKARSPAFRRTLREGNGGRLLAADAGAIATVAALEAGDSATASRSIVSVFPPAPVASAAAVSSAPAATGGKKNVKATAPAPPTPPPPTTAGAIEPSTLSPHLNFALGKWLLSQNRAAEAATLAESWTRTPLAPARAFRWDASHKADDGRWDSALATLQEGRQRLAIASPFLPDMVTYAKSAGSKQQAEDFVDECRKEGQKDQSVVAGLATLIGGKATGTLYATCLQRLGYVPAKAQSSLGGVLSRLRKAGEGT